MTHFNHLKNVDRRTFLKQLSLAGAAGLVLPRGILQAGTSAKSRVCIIKDVGATSGNSIDGSVVQAMIRSGIMSLGQVSDVAQAWKMLLPGVTSASKIAIKVNCNTSLATHPVVTYAIADSLKTMTFSGVPFPENNIIIYEISTLLLRDSGYTINTGTNGVRCYGTDGGYSSQTFDVAGVSQRLSRIPTEAADFLINVSVLKNHWGAGVTLCLKNHYGTCDHPDGLHGSSFIPYAGALNALAPMKAKQKVNIIDALYGIRSGGPVGPPQFVANRIIMSTDVVAADYQGRKLLQDNGCTTTMDAGHIDAAASTYGLGTNDPAQMEVVQIMNPSTTVVNETPVPSQLQLHQNYPNPFNPSTRVMFDLPRAEHAELNVYDTTGRLVANLAYGQLAAGTHVVTFDASGLASGTYICRLQTGGAQISRTMVYLK